MAQRTLGATVGVAEPPDPGATPPTIPSLSPLDLVLLGSLNAAVAQMVGLYWVDQTAEPGVAYDYLIAASYNVYWTISVGAAGQPGQESTPFILVDEGSQAGPATWSVSGGMAHQTSNIYTPPNDRHTLSKLGALALAGSTAWTDVVISARLRSVDDDTIGVVFRRQNSSHFYRFSMDAQHAYRRLVKNVGGTWSLLWEDDVAFTPGQTYLLTIVAVGSSLRGFLDGVPLFAVDDADIASGRIGLYSWHDAGAHFGEVRVYPGGLAFDSWLLRDRFNVLAQGRWTFVDDPEQVVPGIWTVDDGALRQTSNALGGTAVGSDPVKPGPCAIAGDPAWTDYRLVVRLRSDDDDAIGALFRYRDEQSYYRFSMDRQQKYRRFVKCVDGVTTVLWQDAVHYVQHQEYLLTLDCLGERLTGYLNGVRLFSVEDADLALPPGEYRLRFTYRRDNTALAPGSLVLSQAGDSMPEAVQIDVPATAH